MTALALPHSLTLGVVRLRIELSSRAASPDADPVIAARGGDERAFEALYRTHVARVFALALRLSDDPAHAEELTQDVFVRAWECSSEPGSGSPPSGARAASAPGCSGSR